MTTVRVILCGANLDRLSEDERAKIDPDAGYYSWMGVDLFFDLEAIDLYEQVFTQTLEHAWESVLIEQYDLVGGVRDIENNWSAHMLTPGMCSEKIVINRFSMPREEEEPCD